MIVPHLAIILPEITPKTPHNNTTVFFLQIAVFIDLDKLFTLKASLFKLTKTNLK